MAKILRLVNPLDEDTWHHTLPLRDSQETLNTTHEDPPYPLIYHGLPGTYICYARMSIFVQEQFSSSLIGTFGTQEIVTPSISQMHQNPSQFPLRQVSQNRTNSISKMDLLDVTSTEWLSPLPKTKRHKTGIFMYLIL